MPQSKHTHKKYQGKSQRDQLKKSASSSVMGRHNHQCMCQVCTCYRPEHKCPINYINPKMNAKTNYQNEYKQYKIEKPDIWVAKDNLISNKKFNGNTEYKNAFQKRKGRESLIRDHGVRDKWEKMVVEHNIKSHIGDIMGKGQRPISQHRETEKQRYYQPSKFVKPNQKVVKPKKFNEKTDYQKNYTPKDASYTKPLKVNYDNLFVGHPDYKQNKQTEYQQAHSPYKIKEETAHQPNINHDIYKIIKEKNQMTHTLPKDTKEIKKTEYGRHYTPKEVKHHVCDMNKMPKVPRDKLKSPDHVMFCNRDKNWHRGYK